MDPLVATVLSAFGLLLAFSLTVWMALTLRQRVVPQDDEEEEFEADATEHGTRPGVSNDEVRGARAGRPWPLRRRPAAAQGSAAGAPWAPGMEPGATPGGNGEAGDRQRPAQERHRPSGEDPFERFLRDRSDRSARDDFDF